VRINLIFNYLLFVLCAFLTSNVFAQTYTYSLTYSNGALGNVTFNNVNLTNTFQTGFIPSYISDVSLTVSGTTYNLSTATPITGIALNSRTGGGLTLDPTNTGNIKSRFADFNLFTNPTSPNCQRGHSSPNGSSSFTIRNCSATSNFYTLQNISLQSINVLNTPSIETNTTPTEPTDSQEPAPMARSVMLIAPIEPPVNNIVTVSSADTQQSLLNNASALQGTIILQNTIMINGFTYDCPVFDKNGICISSGGRNTTVATQGTNNSAGLLIASYRLNDNNGRIGAWVDQNTSANNTPMIGLFGVWSENLNGTGTEIKISAAYGQKNTTVTRQVIGTSEPGSGSYQLISQGAQIITKYGFALMRDAIFSPYAGIRYTQNNMNSYTETTTSSVTMPLTYGNLNTNMTTVLAGLEAKYKVIPETTLLASFGMETDTNTFNGSYSATGVLGLTPINLNSNPVKTRPTVTLGGYYDVTKTQRFSVMGIYRQEPFWSMSTTTFLVAYIVGF
jgi:hypothetical protein